jgi:hypothetical protein
MFGTDAHSNELTRGPMSERFSTFVYRGSSHRRKSAACPKFDMVWLYRSPIPVGRRRVISSFKRFLPALRYAWRKGEGRWHPVVERFRYCKKKKYAYELERGGEDTFVVRRTGRMDGKCLSHD